MPKERVVVPGRLKVVKLKTVDGHEIEIFHPSASSTAMELWPDEWVPVRTYATGIHICDIPEPENKDKIWEDVVFE